jgi:hypothetical protein
MGQITTGNVEFTTPRPFEANSAKVSLSFTTEGEPDVEAFVHFVGQMARRQAYATLTADALAEAPKPRAKRNPADVVIGASPTLGSSTVLAETSQAVLPQQPAEGSSVVALVPVASVDPMTGQPTPASPSLTVVGGTDAMGLPTSAPVAGGPATGASPSVPSGINDAELTGLISQKVAHLAQLVGDAAVPKVVELVEQFVPAPGRSTQMTQEQRVEFVARLKSLA